MRWLVALCVVAGCNVTETGNPPIAPVLEEEQVEVVLDPIFVPGVVHLTAGPGTVDPPEGDVVVTYLDGTTPADRLAVQADGSFDGNVSADDGIVRLQVAGPSARSVPVDYQLDAGTGALTPVTDPLPCLRMDTSSPVAAGGAAQLPIDNGCGTDVTFVPRLRLGDAGFSVADAMITLEAGSALSLEARQTGEPAEEILFVEVSVPSVARIAVSLFADPGG